MSKQDDLTTGHTVLVTGAAGFLGVPVVQRLCATGCSVVAVDDGSAGTLSRLEKLPTDPRLTVRVLDIRDRTPLMNLVATVRPWAVIHLAARHFIPACEACPTETLDVNVLGTQHLLDACAEYPPRRFLLASSADVYAPSTAPHAEDDLLQPRGVYGSSKLLGEALLRDQVDRIPGCDTVVARLFNLYGPGDPHPHLVPEILTQADRGAHLQLGDLSTARDFVYIDDAAEAVHALLHTNNVGTVNIGSGRATTGHELIESIAELMDQQFEIRCDLPGRRFPRPVLHAVTDKLRRVLPWWPRTSLHDGLRCMLAEQACGRWAS
jgi:UDP-glucose 4-epimerase